MEGLRMVVWNPGDVAPQTNSPDFPASLVASRCQKRIRASKFRADSALIKECLPLKLQCQNRYTGQHCCAWERGAWWDAGDLRGGRRCEISQRCQRWVELSHAGSSSRGRTGCLREKNTEFISMCACKISAPTESWSTGPFSRNLTSIIFFSKEFTRCWLSSLNSAPG